MPDLTQDDMDNLADLETRIALSKELVDKYGWPEPLAKATLDDPWTYSLQLRSGEVIVFSGAVPQAPGYEWAKLSHWNEEAVDKGPAKGGLVGRGLFVRVNDIVWCFDHDF